MSQHPHGPHARRPPWSSGALPPPRGEHGVPARSPDLRLLLKLTVDIMWLVVAARPGVRATLR